MIHEQTIFLQRVDKTKAIPQWNNKWFLPAQKTKKKERINQNNTKKPPFSSLSLLSGFLQFESSHLAATLRESNHALFNFLLQALFFSFAISRRLFLDDLISTCCITNLRRGLGFCIDAIFSSGETYSSSNLAKFELKLISINSFTVMIPMDNYCVPSTSTTGLVFSANSSMNASSGFHLTVNSPASVTGLKHEASLAVDWSVEEQYILEKGLAKFKDEPQVTKYVKIAATLPDKSVRDVAMRCKWMTQKRRKGEEHSTGTKVSYRKVVDLPPKLNMFSAVPQQNATYVMNHMRQSAHMPFEGLSDAVMERLRQNTQAFSQISSNLSVCKPQDNISLFYMARNNISAILNDMKEMPGIISRMPPLPVSINNDLASSLMTSTTQPRSYIIPSSIHLKQEPRH